MVGILFCFMNGEVRAEIIKKWKRWRMMQTMHISQGTSHHFTATQRTSIGSEVESVPPNRNASRNPSIQSIKASASQPPSRVDEAQFLLSIDDNQNELRLKQNINDQRS